MRTREVDSSNLKSVAYDRKTKIMYVTFQSGHCYSYDNVSYYRYLKLMKAPSHGVYFCRYVRMKYIYHKLS